MIITIQGSELCAKAMIRVNDWGKLEGIRKNKGKSYRNTVLIGLTFDISQDSLSTEFIYKDILFTID